MTTKPTPTREDRERAVRAVGGPSLFNFLQTEYPSQLAHWIDSGETLPLDRTCAIAVLPLPRVSQAIAEAREEGAAKSLAEFKTLHTIDEWHDDHGSVLWWHLPINEPPYVGQPGDSDWPGYHTHWTMLIVPDNEDDQ